MATFPDDHPNEHLRGRTIPEPGEVLRQIDLRISWLTHRLNTTKINGKLPGPELPELKSLVMLRAMHEQAYPASDTDPPPAPEPGDAS